LNKPILALTILFSLMVMPVSFAEYRVYQYAVMAQEYSVLSPQLSLVTSTLDPQTYTAYHGGPVSTRADLLRTWLCPGYTGQNALPCQAPGDQKTLTSEAP
jgi:hypothetical protein